MVCDLQSLWCMHIKKYGDIQPSAYWAGYYVGCMHIKKYGDIQRRIAENRFLHRCMCIENIGNIQLQMYAVCGV